MSQQVAQGKKCIQWLEGADPHTWKDNYLCNKPYSGAYGKSNDYKFIVTKIRPELGL